MAGARDTITIDTDDAEVRRRLRALMGVTSDLSPVLREIGEILLASTKDRFSPGRQRSPSGVPWAPNSPVTLARKANPNILTERGYLGDTIRYQLTADRQGVEVASDRPYAAMQQFGGTKAQWPHLWGDIPAREFLGISGQDRTDILDAVADALRRAVE